MLRDMLQITTATVDREIFIGNGMGGGTISTTTTSISRCAIWDNSFMKSYMSDKFVAKGSHTFVCEPSTYTFNINDKRITYNGNVYQIKGMPDDVCFKGEVLVLPIERTV
jgi:hypothetical protein